MRVTKSPCRKGHFSAFTEGPPSPEEKAGLGGWVQGPAHTLTRLLRRSPFELGFGAPSNFPRFLKKGQSDRGCSMRAARPLQNGDARGVTLAGGAHQRRRALAHRAAL